MMSYPGNPNERFLNVRVRIDERAVDTKRFPMNQRPELVGFYSVSSERKFQDSDEHMAYYHKPTKFPLDLNDGIEQAQHRPQDPAYLELQFVCQYIQKHQDLLQTTPRGNLSLGVDFVTTCDSLCRIMCAPYEYTEDQRWMATRLNGTVYLCECRFEADSRANRAHMTEDHLNVAFWGLKFKQSCLSASPNVEPANDKFRNECAEFDCLFRSNVNNLRLLYAAGIDGVSSPTVVDLNSPDAQKSMKLLNLKTIVWDKTLNQRRIFNEQKSLSWWAQSFLAGIKTIVAGMSTRDGLVLNTENYAVDTLPLYRPWSGKVAAIFLENFLVEVKLLLEYINDPYAVLQLDFKAKSGRISYQVLKGPHITQIIPDWYRQLMETANCQTIF